MHKILVFYLFTYLPTSLLSNDSQTSDIYGPKPFYQVLESDFSKSWSPNVISIFENRKHIVLLDETGSSYIAIDNSTTPSLMVKDLSIITNSESSYGDIMRAMFQILDKNTKSLSDSILADHYSLHPELFSYYSIDILDKNSMDLIVRDIGTYYMDRTDSNGYLIFTFNGAPSSTKIQASYRLQYDTSLEKFILDTSWSSNYWLSISDSKIKLVDNENSATNFKVTDANDLINVTTSSGSDFNPSQISWQTNTFASIPDNIKEYDEIMNLEKDVDPIYQNQFYNTTDASTAAEKMLDLIETSLLSQGDSLRYSKNVYMTFRENLLSHKIGAVDMVNVKLNEPTVEHVYFTNAKDAEGKFHPFMCISTYNAPGGPQFLIDVVRPPGDGMTNQYETQTVTRNAYAKQFLVKIPLKHYGNISNLTDNNLDSWLGEQGTNYGSLTSDEGETDYNVYNYSSKSSVGITADGVILYPSYNNTLKFTPFAGEITSTGIHVGRGMNFHYHADGHGFLGNGINLYNLIDYDNRNHPPLIGFELDGIALFGKYENNYSEMHGYNENLDEYGGHDHDDYGYHNHAFNKNISQNEGNTTVNFTQHFLSVGAWKGKINEIPGFLSTTESQLKNEYAQFAGASNCDGNGSEYDCLGICGGNANIDDCSELTASSNNIRPQLLKIDTIYPNPFNPELTINYKVNEFSSINISVFSLNGQLIYNLYKGDQNPGNYSLKWDAKKFTSGIYLIKLSSDSFNQTQKAVLIK